MSTSNQQLQNLLRLFLAFYVGGVGSLVYFDGLMPGHIAHEHPFHISLLEEVSHPHNPLPPPAAILAHQIKEQLARNVTGYPLLDTSPYQLPGGIYLFYTSLSRGYLLHDEEGHHSTDDNLIGRVSSYWLKERLPWLPPLEKPPSSHQVC